MKVASNSRDARCNQRVGWTMHACKFQGWRRKEKDNDFPSPLARKRLLLPHARTCDVPRRCHRPYLCCIKIASDVHGSNVLKVDCPDYRYVCVLLMYTPDRATTAKSGMENDYNGATQRGDQKLHRCLTQRGIFRAHEMHSTVLSFV